MPQRVGIISQHSLRYTRAVTASIGNPARVGLSDRAAGVPVRDTSRMMGSRVTTYTIQVGGQRVAYTVRRSTRAKRLQMRYLAGQGFEVVLPQRVPLREV